jgi:hypothetical protein
VRCFAPSYFFRYAVRFSIAAEVTKKGKIKDFGICFDRLSGILSKNNSNCNAKRNAIRSAYLFSVLHYYCKVQEVMQMVFQIKSNGKETENKTIRFPIPLLEKINNAIKDNNVTFSRFVIQACEYALDNMETTNETDEDPPSEKQQNTGSHNN